MRIPTSDQLLLYILDTTMAIHTLLPHSLDVAQGSLEYKLKGDVTLYIAMYGPTNLEPFWSSIGEACNALYDLKIKPNECDQINPLAHIDTLRQRLRRHKE